MGNTTAVEGQHLYRGSIISSEDTRYNCAHSAELGGSVAATPRLWGEAVCVGGLGARLACSYRHDVKRCENCPGAEGKVLMEANAKVTRSEHRRKSTSSTTGIDEMASVSRSEHFAA
nr:hypothetical protein CFP56_22422 [Quercus suber]